MKRGKSVPLAPDRRRSASAPQEAGRRNTSSESPPEESNGIQELLKEELGFQRLIAELSAAFIKLPPASLDDVILDSQRRVCEQLGLDVSTLWQRVGEMPTHFRLTHLYRLEGGPPPPEPMLAHEHFPWCVRNLAAGCIVVISTMDELPPEAALDAESHRFWGIKSALDIPLSVGGGPTFGFLTFGTTRAERPWPDSLQQRVLLVAHVVANALARKEADRALRASEEQSRVGFEQTAVGMAYVGIDGRLLRVNNKVCEILGYRSDELLQMTFRDISDRADLDGDLDLDRDRRLLSAAVDDLSVEKRFIRKNGTQIWVKLTLSLMRYITGEPEHRIAVLEEITERKRAEAELRQLRLVTWHAERVAQIGAITGSLAHELNQPLAAILTNAQAALRFMEREDFDVAEIRAVLRDIARDDKRAAAVISSLRTMLLRRSETQRESVNLTRAVDMVLDLLHAKILSERVTIVRCFERVSPIWVNETQIDQVLINLVLNAIEAMQSEPLEGRKLEVALRQPNAEEVVLAIRDSGPGIPADLSGKVFEGFWTTKQDGLGIGLALSRSIAESHGGRLWFAANPDRGTTFYFALPVDRNAER